MVTPSIVSSTLINICFMQQYEITFGNWYKTNKRFNDKKTIKQRDKTLSSRWIKLSRMTTLTQVGKVISSLPIQRTPASWEWSQKSPANWLQSIRELSVPEQPSWFRMMGPVPPPNRELRNTSAPSKSCNICDHLSYLFAKLSSATHLPSAVFLVDDMLPRHLP